MRINVIRNFLTTSILGDFTMQKNNGNSNFSIADLFLKHPGVTDTPKDIESYVKKQIDMRMSRLRRIMAFKRLNVQDVRQDFLLAIVSAMANYDAEKSGWRTFVSSVCNKKYCYLMRTYQNEKKFLLNLTSLDTIDEESESLPSYETDFDTQIDVDTAMEGLSDRLRNIAEMLKHNSPAQVAKQLGVSRTTIGRAMKHLRTAFLKNGLGPKYLGVTN